VNNKSIILEMFEYIKERKVLWLIPVLFLLLLFGTLIIFTGTNALSPFLYAFF
jgi:hypothetical protein